MDLGRNVESVRDDGGGFSSVQKLGGLARADDSA